MNCARGNAHKYRASICINYLLYYLWVRFDINHSPVVIEKHCLDLRCSVSLLLHILDTIHGAKWFGREPNGDRRALYMDRSRGWASLVLLGALLALFCYICNTMTQANACIYVCVLCFLLPIATHFSPIAMRSHNLHTQLHKYVADLSRYI